MFSQRFLPIFRWLVLCPFGYNHLVKIKIKFITFQELFQKVQVNITCLRFLFPRIILYLAGTNCFYNIFFVHISKVHSTLLTSLNQLRSPRTTIVYFPDWWRLGSKKINCSLCTLSLHRKAYRIRRQNFLLFFLLKFENNHFSF